MGEKKIYYSLGLSPGDSIPRAQIKIRRSIFICALASVSSADQAREFISRISKENRTATHNCWAYIVGETGETSHCSDGGEPSGTAGLPMLNTLRRNELTQVAAVVTRHYGGVKLGVKGLIQAYSEAVEAGLALMPLKRLVKTREIRVTLSYAVNEIFLGQMGQFQMKIIHTEYAQEVVHHLAVDQDDLPGVEKMLSGYQAQGRLRFHLLLPDQGV